MIDLLGLCVRVLQLVSAVAVIGQLAMIMFAYEHGDVVPNSARAHATSVHDNAWRQLTVAHVNQAYVHASLSYLREDWQGWHFCGSLGP